MKQEFRNLRKSTLAAAIGLAMTVGSYSFAQDNANEEDYANQAPAANAEAPEQEYENRAADNARGSQRNEENIQAESGEKAGDNENYQAQSGEGAGIDALSERNSDLSKFVEIVKASGLADALAGGEYTVFAPTNEAFEGMDGESIDDLMSAENRAELISLLRAHIVADNVDSQMAGQLQAARTIDGGSVELMSEDGSLKVGDAEVVEADIEIGNLTVHAIDGVLQSNPNRVAQVRNRSQQADNLQPDNQERNQDRNQDRNNLQ